MKTTDEIIKEFAWNNNVSIAELDEALKILYNIYDCKTIYILLKSFFLGKSNKVLVEAAKELI